MKVKIQEPKSQFQPITIELTLERIEDLQWLYAIANTFVNDAIKYCYNRENFKAGTREQMALFNAIEPIATKYL